MKILKLKDVAEMTALSSSTIYRLMANNSFPKQVKLSDRAIGWVDSEIKEFIQEKIAKR